LPNTRVVVHDEHGDGRLGAGKGCKGIEVCQSRATLASLREHACREFWMLALFERGQPMLDGQFDNSRKIRDMKFLHHATAVGVYRLRRQM
jgi:hypothetical protein